jgi:hypothetical protein
MTHTTTQLLDVSGDSTTALTLALTIAQLQQTFYTNGLAAATTLGLSTNEQAAITTIHTQDSAHVTLLSSLVAGVTPPTFDFTGGSGSGTGPFAPFTNKTDFLALAQLLEDASVRIVKGQFSAVLGTAALTTLFQLQSVDARHSAQIRTLRGQSPYMPGAFALEDYGASFTAEQTPIAIAVYGPAIAEYTPTGQVLASAGEDNAIQMSTYVADGVNASNTAAFDEPLSTANATVVLAFFTA